MIYISTNNSQNNIKIKKIINNANSKLKIDEKTHLDSSNLRKVDLIITDDSNPYKIKYLLNLKKNVLLSDKSELIGLNEYEIAKLNFYSNIEEIPKIAQDIIKKSHNKKNIAKSICVLLLIIPIVLFGINIKNMSQKETIKKQNKSKEKIVEKEVIKETQKEENNQENNDNKKKLDYRKENIVFYGDSITDYYNLRKFYPGIPVVNSGTAGFQTQDLINLVEERVYVYNPTKVFLMIGTNDIEFTDLSDEELVDNIKEIINLIRDKRKKTKIYVESIYPVNNTDDEKVDKEMVKSRSNDRIKKINKLIKEMCKKEKVTYIDIYDLLTDEDGNLKLDYTHEGLHINDNGYEVITNELMKYVEQGVDSFEEPKK